MVQNTMIYNVILILGNANSHQKSECKIFIPNVLINIRTILFNNY